MILTSHDIVVFTDGSSRGNPGPGGFGTIVIVPKKYDGGRMKYEVQEIGGREEKTTNNRMELRAAIEGLLFLSKLPSTKLPITIHTDSSYLINGITKWVYGWQKNGWKTKEKKDVENRDLWEDLISAVRGKDIEWRQFGGHVGVAGNMRCDEIATAFADLSTSSRRASPMLFSGTLSEYPIKNILDIQEDSFLADTKELNRAHSNAKAYSYVSSVDGVIQTHKTWAECEARVKGKNAKYKKVLSASEEKNLIEGWIRA